LSVTAYLAEGIYRNDIELSIANRPFVTVENGYT